MAKDKIQRILESINLGIGQILLWGGSYFMLSILGQPMMDETHWSHDFIYGSLSLAMLISGLISPKIGKAINSQDRNLIMPLSGLIMAIGLAMIALSHYQTVFILGWIFVGIAMGMGLYDALFASLGKKYGRNASQSIAQIMLISGFTTTIIWPFLSLLNDQFGWRNTLFIFSAILIVFTIPTHIISFLKSNPTQTNTEKIELNTSQTLQEKTTFVPDLKLSFYLLLINFTIGTVLMTGIYVYILEILQHKGLSINEAITITAFLGPAQVCIRAVDVLLPKRTPVITAIISAITIFIAFILLLFSPTIAAIGVVLFGLGNGLRSILRGTLPLWIYRPKIYATMIGKLAVMPLIAQALTPFFGGLIMQNFGINALQIILCMLAFISIFPMILLQKVMKGYRIEYFRKSNRKISLPF